MPISYTKDSQILSKIFSQGTISNTHLSRISTGLLKTIFEKSKEAIHKSEETGAFRTNDSQIVKRGDSFPKSGEYDYICEPIRESINTSHKFIKTFNIQMRKRKFEIFLVFPFQKEKLTHKEIENYEFASDIYIKRIYTLLYMVDHFACNECSKQVNIFIYYSDHTKKLPSISGDAIDRIHVNSAFTTSCSESTEINIFRKEEWFKVLIHESFHNMGLDFSNEKNFQFIKEAHQAILKRFPIESNIKLYETYCEMWATIINIIMIQLFKEPNKSFSSIVASIDANLYLEQNYSLFQTAKILNHFGLDYVNLYDKTEKSAVLRNRRYKEKTEIFSYYILKTLFLFRYNDFIEWCVVKNRGSIMFHSPNSNIMNYVESLILSKYDDASFVNAINTVQHKYFKSNSALIKQDRNFVYNTMRMTATEII